MLAVYRRHRSRCDHKDDRISKKCRCPIWATGTIEGRPYRRSMKTRSFERAEQLKREIEDGTKEEQKEEVSIREAFAAFITDCEARNLHRRTVAKYRCLEERLDVFWGAWRMLGDLDSALIRRFRETWELAPRTAIKELERLRAFFRFCQDNEWISRNPALGVKSPQVKLKPRVPFNEGEVKRILEKCRSDVERAFVLVLRHTGLRIGDASLLSISQFQSTENRIHLYTTKTGAPVSVIIPAQLSNLLKSQPAPGGYFFLRGNSTLMHTTTNLWRRVFKRICREAGVYPEHAHRFRATLACDLLVKGASVEDVAAILGNSPQIVQKHYSQFIKARQDRLDSIVSSTWQPTLVRVK